MSEQPLEVSPWFTDEDKQEAGESTLGAEYFAARRVASEFMPQFREKHFEGLIKEFSEKFRDHLWDDVCAWLLTDTEYNLQASIARMVEDTVTALLSGEEWAMRRYPYEGYSNGEKIRAAIAKHSGDEIARRRIADLEKENETLRERASEMRRWS